MVTTKKISILRKKCRTRGLIYDIQTKKCRKRKSRKTNKSSNKTKRKVDLNLKKKVQKKGTMINKELLNYIINQIDYLKKNNGYDEDMALTVYEKIFYLVKNGKKCSPKVYKFYRNNTDTATREMYFIDEIIEDWLNKGKPQKQKNSAIYWNQSELKKYKWNITDLKKLVDLSRLVKSVKQFKKNKLFETVFTGDVCHFSKKKFIKFICNHLGIETTKNSSEILLDKLYKLNPKLFNIFEYEEWIDNLENYGNKPSNFCKRFKK